MQSDRLFRDQGLHSSGLNTLKSVTGASGYTVTQQTNSSYTLVMQNDGNLVIYKTPNGTTTTSPIWSTGTQGKGTAPYRCLMQADNNIVVYDNVNNLIWQSSTRGKGNGYCTMIMQSDGNFVLYDSQNNSVWSTNTAGK